MARRATPPADAARVTRLLILVALLVLTLRLAWVHETRSPVRAADAAPQLLVVPSHASADAVGRQLTALGLVRNPLVFRALVLARGVSGSLKAGEYSLEGPLTLDQIVSLLARGEVVRREVTIPEGKSLEDMAAIVAAHGLDAEEFKRAARDPTLIRELDPTAADLEGYLFPDTYEIPGSANPSAALVTRMVQRFRERMVPALPRLAREGLTLREAVTLASLVELETARGEERPRIAAVFRNRLRRKMLLQTDPTVIYALRQKGTWDGNIRKKDLDIDSPYNTYRFPGLPPGPIASPGIEALRAVIDPADVKDLYFVSRNDGSHQFSETLTEHNRAVDRYQRGRRGSRLAAPPSPPPGPPGTS